MRRHLPLLALIAFACFLGGIVWHANHGRGFWSFLETIPGGDKIGHLILVGTFAFLFNLALRNRRLPAPFHRILLGSGLVAMLMTVEELSQIRLPHRSPDLLDGLANLIGAGLGQIASLATTPPPRAALPDSRDGRR